MIKEKERGYSLVPVVIEISIILFLVLLVTVVLNYFNIVPLSKTVGFLSFLPHQSSQSTQNDSKNPPNTESDSTIQQIQPVILSDKPLTTSNSEDIEQYKYIENSSIEVNGALRIEVEMISDVSDAADDSGNSGIFFTNGLPYADKNFRFLHIFHYKKDKSWVLEYRANDESKYYFIAPAESSKSFISASIELNAQGTAATVSGVNIEKKTFDLSNSLYESGKQMSMVTQISPNANLTINSLVYYR